jgi:hypothetical protein
MSGTAASSDTRSSEGNASAFMSASFSDALSFCCSIAHIPHVLKVCTCCHGRLDATKALQTCTEAHFFHFEPRSVQVRSTLSETLPRHSAWRQAQGDPCVRFGPGSVLSAVASTAAELPYQSWP